MSTKQLNVKLNDGNNIPIVGLGTYQAPKGETKQVVTLALKAGYRHFDCADFYENEDEVGEALAEAFANDLVKREQVFITTKVWPNWHASGRPTQSVKRSLKNLGLTYVDLLLIHWPTPFEQDDDHFYPVDKDNQILLDETIDLVEVWKEFEQIKSQGLFDVFDPNV